MEITQNTKYCLVLNKLTGNEYGTFRANLHTLSFFEISPVASLVCTEQDAVRIYKTLVQNIKSIGKVTVLELSTGIAGGQIIGDDSRMTVFDK